MSALNIHRPPSITPSAGAPTESPSPAPLLVGIDELAVMLSRSIPSLRRDDAAGRLPLPLRIGGSKRWRAGEIVRWVEAGCPDRKTWIALNH